MALLIMLITYHFHSNPIPMLVVNQEAKQQQVLH
jgi:hypothetical protein